MDWDDLIKDAKDSGYSNVILPADEYEAKVASATFNQKSGKKDNIWIKWEVLTGPYAGEKVSDNLYPNLDNPRSMGVVLSKLKGAGITNEFLSSLKDKYGPLHQAPTDHFKAICGELTGLQAVLKVEESEWNGKPKNEVWPQRPLETTQSTEAPAKQKENPYAKPVNPEMPI